MIPPGTPIDKYVVERHLGGGGMAEVYLVRHAALGTKRALKVLNPDIVHNDEIRQRFLAEGQIQARLLHPNIVPVIDIVAVPGVAGLVMDYVEGVTLDLWLEGLSTPPPPEVVKAIFKQVLEAVGHAHANGIIHRDLKPANVILETLSDGTRRARILDFGIAKVLQGGVATEKRATRAGARMGTLHYMSPEQIKGAADVTIRSDIYSLGVTLYEFATKRPAFDGDSDYQVMHKVATGDFKPPEEVHPGIDPDLADAIVISMEADPEDRFETCAEFMDVLEHGFEEGEAAPLPPLARPVSPPPVAPSQVAGAAHEPVSAPWSSAFIPWVGSLAVLFEAVSRVFTSAWRMNLAYLVSVRGEEYEAAVKELATLGWIVEHEVWLRCAGTLLVLAAFFSARGREKLWGLWTLLYPAWVALEVAGALRLDFVNQLPATAWSVGAGLVWWSFLASATRRPWLSMLVVAVKQSIWWLVPGLWSLLLRRTLAEFIPWEASQLLSPAFTVVLSVVIIANFKRQVREVSDAQRASASLVTAG